MDEQEFVSSGDFTQQDGTAGDLVALEKRVEGQLVAYDRLLKATVSRTLPSDWVDQSGIPYLMATGAERIARPWGIYIKNVQVTKEDRSDAKGDYFIYWAKGIVGSRLLDSELEFMGSCSSRDKFFGLKDGQLKEIEDVDETNIRKKAWNNLFINGVTRLLGLRRLSWQFLKDCGIEKTGVTRVDYGGKGATTNVSEAQTKLLYAKMMGKVKEGASEEVMKEDFEKQFGVKEFKDLPKNKMNDAIAFFEEIKI